MTTFASWSDYLRTSNDVSHWNSVPRDLLEAISPDKVHSDEAAATAVLVERETFYLAFAGVDGSPVFLTNIRRKRSISSGAITHVACVIPPVGRIPSSMRFDLISLCATAKVLVPTFAEMEATTNLVAFEALDATEEISCRGLFPVTPALLSIFMDMVVDDPIFPFRAVREAIDAIDDSNPAGMAGDGSNAHDLRDASIPLLQVMWKACSNGRQDVPTISLVPETSAREIAIEVGLMNACLGIDASLPPVGLTANNPVLIDPVAGAPAAAGPSVTPAVEQLVKGIEDMNDHLVTAEANRQRDRNARLAKTTCTKWPDPIKLLVLHAMMPSQNHQPAPDTFTDDLMGLCRIESAPPRHAFLSHALEQKFNANIALTTGISLAIYHGNFLWEDANTPSNLTLFATPRPSSKVQSFTFDSHLAFVAMDPSLRNVTNDQLKRLTKNTFEVPDNLDSAIQQVKNCQALCRFCFGDDSILSCYLLAWANHMQDNYMTYLARERNDVANAIAPASIEETAIQDLKTAIH